MTSRERVMSAVNFEPPDRLPCGELFWDGTLERWREQGMPGDVTAEDFFGLDLSCMFLDASPRFPQRILRHEGQFTVYEDRFGYTVKRPTGVSGSLQFISHVTTDQKAWEHVKPRLALEEGLDEARIDDASYFAHMEPYPAWVTARAKFDRLRAGGRYLLFRAYGPWNATWRHRGMEELMMDLVTDPDWVRDMLETYEALVLKILGRCLDLGMRPDGFFIFEDMGWRQSTLISPASFRAVLKPSLQRLGRFLEREHIDFWMHSDGAIQAIVDDLLDCGLRVLNPLETAAGLDVRKMREHYGRRLAFYGNISVTNILAGGKAFLDEVQAKAPLAREGGYIFGSDHSIPPQVDLARYQQMLAEARESFARAPSGVVGWE